MEYGAFPFKKENFNFRSESEWANSYQRLMGDVDQSKEEFVAHSLASTSRRIHPCFEDAGFDSNKASMICLYHEPGISFGTSYIILPEGRGHWIQRLRPGQTKSGTGLKQRGPRICPHLRMVDLGRR